MIRLASVRWAVFSSFASVVWPWEWNHDSTWDGPIQVHVDKGVGCVSIVGQSACETASGNSMQDWVEVMPTSCDNSLQTCILAVTIDFGFDPTDTKDKSHPNFRQEFKLDGVTHDVWFAVVHDKYCLYDVLEGRRYSVCSNPNNLYTGEDTKNPYIGYLGPKPTYILIKPDSNAFLYNEIELASNLNQMPTNDIGIQAPSIIKLASSDLGFLSNDEVARNDYYGILSNGEPVVPEISNSIRPLAGTPPVPWMA